MEFTQVQRSHRPTHRADSGVGLILNDECTLLASPNAPLTPAHILDASITLDPTTGLFACTTHCKRDLPKFDVTNFGKYPSAKSLLRPQVSHGIVTSEPHRAYTITNLIPAFTTQLAGVIHELLCKGRALRPTLARYKDYLLSQTPLFPAATQNPNNSPQFIFDQTGTKLKHSWANGLSRLEHRNARCNFETETMVPKGQLLQWPTFNTV